MRVIMIDDNGRQHDITAQVKNIIHSSEIDQERQHQQPVPNSRFGQPMAAPQMGRPQIPQGGFRRQIPTPQGMPMQGRVPMGGQRIPTPMPMPQGMPMGAHRIPAPQGGFARPMGMPMPAPQGGFARPMGMPMPAPQGMPMGGQEFGDDQMIPVAIDPMTGQPMDFNQMGGQQMPEPSAAPAGSPYYRPYWQQNDQQGEFAGQGY